MLFLTKFFYYVMKQKLKIWRTCGSNYDFSLVEKLCFYELEHKCGKKHKDYSFFGVRFPFISAVLGYFSYDNFRKSLPSHLRGCSFDIFIFPNDFKIALNKLINALCFYCVHRKIIFFMSSIRRMPSTSQFSQLRFVMFSLYLFNSTKMQ